MYNDIGLFFYFSVVSRRFYPSKMYIMSQSLLSHLRIDKLLPSAPTALRLVRGSLKEHIMYPDFPALLYSKPVISAIS